jgi:hypothetical protein
MGRLIPAGTGVPVYHDLGMSINPDGDPRPAHGRRWSAK